MIKTQEYHKISDDMREIEALKKMAPFFEHVRVEIASIKDKKEKEKHTQIDAKALIT